MEQENKIKCPDCGLMIDVNEALYLQLEEKIKKDFDKKANAKEKEIQAKIKELEAEKEKIKNEKAEFGELVAKEVQTKLKSEKEKIEKNISVKLKEETAEQIKNLQKELEEKSDQVKELNKTKAEIERLKRDQTEMKEKIVMEKEKEFTEKMKLEKTKIKEQLNEEAELKIKELQKLMEEQKVKSKEEVADQIKSLQKELEEKTGQVKELNKTKAEIEKLKREKDELRDLIALEKEKEYSEKIKEEKQKIKKQADEESAFKIKELEKQLEVQKNLAEEMKRKAEQGSMQLQGEVQELALEDLLTTMFPFDLISGVAKGVKGADVIQEVRNKIGTVCGTILYESKRTKAFSNEWINKLKADAVAMKADLCIIVTEAMPDGIDKIGEKNGVWICTFNDIKGLALVLRENLIKLNEAYNSQTNKGEKMQMLYDYLLSNEFRLQIGAIIEGFNELQNSYIQEKRAMERIWKQREKQLEKVLLNTNHFIGSIKGIAGSSIEDLKQIGANDNIIENGKIENLKQ